MSRTVALVSLTVVGTMLLVAAAGAAPVRASDCRRVSVDLTPVTELEPERYQGFRAGLYPDGKNTAPADHTDVALRRAALIQPRRPDGAVAPDGSIVLLSIGMTNATQEWQAFMKLVGADPQVSENLHVVDGAVTGSFSSDLTQPDARYWQWVDGRLSSVGATGEQVQAIWLKQATRRPTGPFPEHAEALQAELEQIVAIAHDRFPNLQVVYLSSRIYAGYATSRVSPEPYAYESAFAVKWLIEKQIGGDPALNPDPDKGEVRAPVLLWGPYLWADGTTGRQDGLLWLCSDFEDDGTQPSPTGEQKVANMLMAFFKLDESAKLWFMADPNATPVPTPTALPTSTPGTAPTRWPLPTPPPGVTPTEGPSPTPVGLKSYRVIEVPTDDQMWVSTSRADVQRQLESIDPSQPLWVCGMVELGNRYEWGFRFDPRTVAIRSDVPALLQATIREIAADPPTGSINIRCIRVGGVEEVRDGTPPPYGTPDARTPSATRSPTQVPPGTTRRIYTPILVHF